MTLAIYSESSEKVTIGCLKCKGVCNQQEGVERLGKYEKLTIKAHVILLKFFNENLKTVCINKFMA